MSNATAALGEAVMPLTTQDVEAIEERAGKATPRPWRLALDCGDQVALFTDCKEHPLVGTISKGHARPHGDANAAFLLAARADVPALCSALRSAWQERDATFRENATREKLNKEFAARVHAAEAALSSASAREAALRAEVERLTRERDEYAKAWEPMRAQNARQTNELRAAESREAALRGERDEARSAFAAMSEQWRALTATAHERAEALLAAETERDAASLGLREALAAIEKAAAILDGQLWHAENDPSLAARRALTLLDNAPEMIRACVVGSIPRSEASQRAGEDGGRAETTPAGALCETKASVFAPPASTGERGAPISKRAKGLANASTATTVDDECAGERSPRAGTAGGAAAA